MEIDFEMLKASTLRQLEKYVNEVLRRKPRKQSNPAGKYPHHFFASHHLLLLFLDKPASKASAAGTSRHDNH